MLKKDLVNDDEGSWLMTLIADQDALVLWALQQTSSLEDLIDVLLRIVAKREQLEVLREERAAEERREKLESEHAAMERERDNIESQRFEAEKDLANVRVIPNLTPSRCRQIPRQPPRQPQPYPAPYPRKPPF